MSFVNLVIIIIMTSIFLCDLKSVKTWTVNLWLPYSLVAGRSTGHMSPYRCMNLPLKTNHECNHHNAKKTKKKRVPVNPERAADFVDIVSSMTQCCHSRTCTDRPHVSPLCLPAGPGVTHLFVGFPPVFVPAAFTCLLSAVSKDELSLLGQLIDRIVWN